MGSLFQRLTLAGIACVIWMLAVAQAVAQDRVALVIGNSHYADVAALTNPAHDAADIAAALGRLGFDVSLLLDLDGRATSRALRDFARRADQSQMALLYFAGHGMEIANRNYLLPVDAQVESTRDVPYEATEMTQFINAVAGAKTLRLVLLDACRNNPFVGRMADASTRSLGRGLARVEPPGGTLVGYSARGGTVAYDGEGRNSPYAAALLEHIEEPGLEIGKLFRRVRDTVYNQTGGLQEPFTYGSLPARDIFLAATPPKTDSDVLRAFARADLLNTTESWAAFLDRFEGTDVEPDILDRARQKRAALMRPAAPAMAAAADSPLIRACDKLAADPADPALPAGVSGVAAETLDITAARTACTLAVSGHPGHGRSLYQFGRVLLADGDTGAAIPALREAARDYLQAQIILGGLFTDGSSNGKDAEEGVALLKLAIEGGSAAAPRLLADYYSRDGFNRTRVGAPGIDLYRLAAQRGDLQGQFEAGYRMLSNTLSTSAERQRGLEFLIAAARRGHVTAQHRLMNHYSGTGPGQNMKSALQYAQMAAENGSAYALKFLIGEYRKGTRIPRDLQEAARWVRYGADKGNATLMVHAGYLFETGRGVDRDPDRATRYYMRALSAGSALPIMRHSSDWDRETVRALQTALRLEWRGRYAGQVDGLVGHGTRDAMQRLCNCPVPSRRVRFGDRF